MSVAPKPPRHATLLDCAARSIMPRVPLCESLANIASSDHDRLSQSVRKWSAALTETYLEAYRAAVTGSELWPQDPDEANDLLEFFLLEKAFYEIEYELSNRPDWTVIPLEATLRILQRRGAIAT